MNKAPASQPSKTQKPRTPSGKSSPPRHTRSVSPHRYTPQGQGETPWHQYSDTRLDDALVARVDLSNGNLMLAETDVDIAGIGRTLQLARTHNSFRTPDGLFGDRTFTGADRYLEFFDNTVVAYGASGNDIAFDRNDDGSFDAPAGYRLNLTKNDDGTYTLTHRKDGLKETYNTDGNLTRTTDHNHNTITYTHRKDGTVTLTEKRTGRSIDLTETDDGYQAKDNTGRTVTFRTDGNQETFTDTAKGTTHYTRDDDGRITKVTTPAGRTTTFTYDTQDRVTSMTRVATSAGTGPVTLYRYTAAYAFEAGTTTLTDPSGHSTAYKHDDNGRVTTVTDALGHHRSKKYDGANNVTAATDAMGTGSTPGNTTTYGWDSRSNPTSAKLPTGATATLGQYQTIAGADLPGTLTDPDGNATHNSYDTAGNLTTEQDTTKGGTGAKRGYTYNHKDPDCGGVEGQRCTATDGNGHTTRFAYDAHGNLTKAAPPAPRGATTYTYDHLGRPITATDGRGVETRYAYDTRDRITKVATDTRTVTYTYDQDGNLTKRTDPTGTTT